MRHLGFVFALATALLLALPSDVMAQACGNVTSIGCCDGTTATYCDKGVLKTKDCPTQTAPYTQCGWRADTGYYTCTDNSNADPSGTYPKDCSTLPDGGIVGNCGTVTADGCCDGVTNKYCNSGGLLIIRDCSAKDPPYNKCGWRADKSHYTCTDNEDSDPSGTLPRACGGGTVDSGPVQQDTGVTPQQDTGVTPQFDTGTTTKLDTGTTPPPKDGDDDGCGCRVGARDVGAPLLLLLAAILSLTLIRRRR